MTSPDPSGISVDPERVTAHLKANPLGAALLEAAQWRTAYEDVAMHAQRLANELQTAREALDVATATPPGPDEQASTPAGT